MQLDVISACASISLAEGGITILNVMCLFFVITERGVYQAKLKELKVCIEANF